ncbi:MAG: cytochrome c biogenesis protein ResB, partial [Bacteroidales bacterium]|nr:cytochrome c biogenesis protein ResB [Bacteroidales bacterium]
MMAATVLEKTEGSAFAFRWVYHNPAFFVLWAVAAVAGLCLVVPRTAKRPWTLLLHVSFVVILAGALLTHLLGEQGFVRLPKGETVSTWIRDDGTARPLPRPITLEDFEVLYYAGSEAPADYHSRIRVEDRVMDISMNHIARVDGYRLFQSGFDEHSSTLAVNHDPWG